MRDREATSRFFDNPFRDPNLPPDKVDYLDRRNASLRHLRMISDPGPAREFGLITGGGGEADAMPLPIVGWPYNRIYVIWFPGFRPAGATRPL